MIMSTTSDPGPFMFFRKRDGLLVPFRREKISNAILKAAEAAARNGGSPISEAKAAEIADEVVAQLDNPLCEYYTAADKDGLRIPMLEDVQNLVEIVLAEKGLTQILTSFKRYRKMRERARAAIKVRNPNEKKDNKKADITDQSLLLVQSTTRDNLFSWDRNRIVKKLIDKLDLNEEEAESVAKEVENQIIASNMKRVTTTLLREMVNNILVERGYNNKLEDLSLYHIPREFIENLMFTKPTENSNIVSNNPEAVNLSIAELILKQWGLDTIFSPAVKEAHEGIVEVEVIIDTFVSAKFVLFVQCRQHFGDIAVEAFRGENCLVLLVSVARLRICPDDLQHSAVDEGEDQQQVRFEIREGEGLLQFGAAFRERFLGVPVEGMLFQIAVGDPLYKLFQPRAGIIGVPDLTENLFRFVFEVQSAEARNFLQP